MSITVGGANPAWGIPAPNATSPAERARRVVFDNFSKKHPDIRLQRYSSLRIQGPAAESGILLAFAGGSAPDVVYVNFRQLRNYVGQGFLRPLNDLIAQTPDVMDRVQPRIKQELMVDGQVYSIPWAQYVQALYYRKDLFRAAGLNPNKPPTNWDEFYAAAKALTDPEKGQYGFVFAQGTESYWWINFLWQAGGEVAIPDPKTGLHLAAFNSDAGVQALEFYRKLLLGEWTDANGKKQVGVATRSSTMRQDISAGKIGMWFAYQSDDVSNMNQYDLNPSLLGIAIMPKGPTGITANEINAGMWGINATVKDPKKLAACWEFIRYMAAEEAARIRVTAYVENGLAQLVNPTELKRWGFEEFITPAQRPQMEASESLFRTGKPEPNGPNMAFIYMLMNEPLDQALLYPDRSAKQILDTSVAKINTKLLNYTPPDEMQRKRVIAWVIFGAVVAGLTALIGLTVSRSLRDAARRRAARAMPGYAAPSGGSSRLPLRTHLTAWAFMAPAVLSIAVWAYLPLLRGMLMAFQEYRILGGSTWIGLDNFIEAVGQETFRIGLMNAFYFTLWLLGLGFFLPIVIALLLNEIPKGKVLFRLLYYLPAVTTSVVVAMLWGQFWKIDGLANDLIGFFGIGPQKWLQDPNQAMFAVVLPLVWAGAGPGSVIYLAALQSIPDEMYEAADLDGAGFFSKIFRVTLPTLSPLIIINLVGATVAAFKVMEPILVQTGGGPDNATYTIGLEIWYNAFMYLKFGYATAAAMLMGSILIGLTMYQLRVLQNVRFAGGNR
ncbi:MAG TPA: extracellular solute-binding protein [Armatimonadaceae bacterium]|nr:extracellular solute-binding protein [Armatimonadaceae bacterium]